YGKEMLEAVVTAKPLAIKGFGLADLTQKEATEIDTEKLRESAKGGKSSGVDWAEHEIEITTVDASAPPPKPAAKRVGVFVGVGKYTHLPANKQLPVCPAHGPRAAETLQK